MASNADLILADALEQIAKLTAAASKRIRNDERAERPTTAALIVERVADEHQIHPTAIYGQALAHHVIRARDQAVFEIRQATGWSWPTIGRFFNRDHSTVLGAARRHEKRMSA